MRIIFLFFLFLACHTYSSANEQDTLAKPGRKFLVFPFFLRSPETNWGFGGASAYFFKVDKKDDSSRTSDVNLIALYTLRKQVLIVLGSSIFFSGEKKLFRFQTSYSYYPDKFWGMGNDLPQSAEEDYTLKQFFFNPQLLFKAYKKFYIGVNVELQNVTDFTYDSGGVFETQQIPGRYGGLTSGAGLLVTWDTRNSAYSPDQGFFAEINLTKFDKLFGSDFNFSSYTTDIRKFFPSGKNRSFALQFYSKLTDGETPIRNIPMLGGSELMRGYYKGRFADQKLIAFQGEVRQHLFWILGATAFAGAGQVAHSVSDFGMDDFHFAYGGGLRIMVQKKEKLNLRVDFGFGKESSGIYVILKEAF